MKNLKAEMARKGVNVLALQKVLNCSEKTVRNKINGVTEFTISEAIEIRNRYFNGLSLDYLFATDDSSRRVR